MDTPVAAADEPIQTIDAPEDESEDEYQVIAKKPRTADDAVKPVGVAVAGEPPAADGNAGNTGDQPAEDMDGVEQTADAEAGPVSDVDWLRSRTNRVLDLVQDDEGPVTAAPSHQEQTAPARQASPEVAPQQVPRQDEPEPEEVNPEDVPTSAEVEKIRETGRLYVRNLHFEVTEEELREHFAKYGALQEVSCLFSFSQHPRNDEYPR